MFTLSLYLCHLAHELKCLKRVYLVASSANRDGLSSGFLNMFSKSIRYNFIFCR